MSLIAAPHCDCADCRAVHWDKDGDPATFSAHEVADAWQKGYDRGGIDALKRVALHLRDWITADEMDPTDCLTEDR